MEVLSFLGLREFVGNCGVNYAAIPSIQRCLPWGLCNIELSKWLFTDPI